MLYSPVQGNQKNTLGIAIAGGRDTPITPNDSSIVITGVAKGSLAYGKLRYGADTTNSLMVNPFTPELKKCIPPTFQKAIV